MGVAALNRVAPPTEAEAKEAAAALRALTRVLQGKKKGAPKLHIRSSGSEGQEVTVPRDAFELFVAVLEQMSVGNAVTVIPVHAELTTQEAANLLNVSRPHLISLLDKGVLPYHMAGTHRRILAQDVLEYRQKDLAAREKVLDELADEAQNLNLGY